MRREKSKAKRRQNEEREEQYVSVRFEGNESKKWDGKEVEIPGKTVVRLAEEGLEKAEVHWQGKRGKAKGKIWKCIVLPAEESQETADAVDSPATAPRRATRGKLGLERELATLERQRTARKLSEVAPDQQVDPSTLTLPATSSGAAIQSGEAKGKGKGKQSKPK